MNNLNINIKLNKENSLIEYLLVNYKKRKINTNIIKNSSKNNNLYKNNAKNNKKYIKYKRLDKIKNKHIFIKCLREKHKTFVEQKNLNLTKNLFNLSKKIEPIINKNKNKYRSLNNECLVETVASSFSHSILLKENFNMFESFYNLTKVIRVYKKEAEVLNVLIISKLIDLYLNLQKDILLFKLNINRGAKTKIKRITKKQPAAFIYGAYLFNPKSTKLFFNNKNLIVQSTSTILNELDQIYYKQRIIFNYISYLSKSIF